MYCELGLCIVNPCESAQEDRLSSLIAMYRAPLNVSVIVWQVLG